MYFDYGFLEFIIKCEVYLSLIILIATIGFQILVKINTTQTERNLLETKNVLKESIKSADNKVIENYKQRWKQSDILLKVIAELDIETKDNSNWLSIRERLLQEIILPLARSNCNSKRWLNRLFAAQSFELLAEKEDASCIEKLLNDKIPLVNLYAALAILKMGNADLINKILDKMANVRRFSRTIHANLFYKISYDKITIIEERLRQEKDPYVRSVCYILLAMFSQTPNHNILRDIESENLELKISAFKYLVSSNPEAAYKQAIAFLNDNHWQLRVVAINVLSKLKQKDAMQLIAKKLVDPSWWVRFDAAKSLLEFGEKGREILIAQNPAKDIFAYETAQFILHKFKSTINGSNNEHS